MRLLKYTVSGVRALEEPVTLEFSKNDCGIKAIYGPTGSGKSSIMESVDIFKNSILTPDYTCHKFTQAYLDNVINKKTREMTVSVEFEDSGSAYTYEMKIQQFHDGKFHEMQGNQCEKVAELAQKLITRTPGTSELDRLYEFIHVFKPDVKSIERGNAGLRMVYDSYKVDLVDESAGVRRLIQLYPMIDRAVHGDIVFVDALDAGLHEVYLTRLVEYLMEYGKGQLCFTAQNVDLMNVLKREKNAINFLSEDHKLYQWHKIGNYSPVNMYRRGMIEGSPFNVDSIDFLNVFGG